MNGIEAHDWLVGGGELGDLIRDRDWANTPLGSRDRWDPCLRTALNLVVESAQTMCLLWGREGLALYNDACRAVLRDQHPGALGRPVQDVWPDVWDVGIRVIGGAGPIRVDDQASLTQWFGARGGARLVLECIPVRASDGSVGGTLLTLRGPTPGLECTDERDVDAMERIWRVSARFFGEDGPQGVLQEILEAAIAITRADFGNIQVIDPHTSKLTIVAQRGFAASWVDFWNGVLEDGAAGTCGAALELQQRVIIEDVTQSALFAGTEALAVQLAAGVRAVQSTPLRTRKGLTLGVVSTHYRTPHRPSNRSLQNLDLLASQAAEVLDRVQSDVAVRRAEAKASGVLRTSADAIISVDEGRRIVEWNQGAEAIFGYSRDQALGMLLDRMLPERHRAIHREHVAGFAREKNAARRMDHNDALGMRSNGEEFPIAATISNLEIDGERILTVSVRDVTERVRAETEQNLLAMVGGALSTRDRNLAMDDIVRIVAGSFAEVAVLFVLDAGGTVGGVASAARAIDGGWVADRMCDVLSRQPISEHPLWRAIDSRLAVLMDLDLGDAELVSISQLSNNLRGGRFASALVVPLVVGDTCLGGLWLAAGSRRFDERDRLLAEEVGRRCALFIDNARLHDAERRATRMRDDVLAVVAHDLRNPLNGIVAQAQLLGRGGQDGGQDGGQRSQKSFDVIRRAAMRMNGMIDDLLDIAQFEAGRFEVAPQVLSARDLVEETVELQRAQVTACSLDLLCSASADLPTVLADKDRVFQVFDNLIGNAMKFTKAGSISVAARAHAREVVFSVADTGTGIAEEHRGQLFDRFWQAREKKRGSIGLGLSIVRAIVESHGGRVWVESRLGVGSTFFFTLPTAADSAVRLADPSTGEEVTGVRSIAVLEEEDVRRDGR